MFFSAILCETSAPLRLIGSKVLRRGDQAHVFTLDPIKRRGAEDSQRIAGKNINGLYWQHWDAGDKSNKIKAIPQLRGYRGVGHGSTTSTKIDIHSLFKFKLENNAFSRYRFFLSISEHFFERN